MQTPALLKLFVLLFYAVNNVDDYVLLLILIYQRWCSVLAVLRCCHSQFTSVLDCDAAKLAFKIRQMRMRIETFILSVGTYCTGLGHD